MPAKCVVILYPHTSNWDLVTGMLAIWALAIRFRWAAKDTLFATPLGPLFRRWGGIPVNRRVRTGFSAAMRDAFVDHNEFRVVIAPEGTRSYAPYWKSGFYHIARASRVPVALGFIDYPRRELGILHCVVLTGNVAADMAEIASHYRGRIGKHPAQQGPVRLHDDTVDEG